MKKLLLSLTLLISTTLIAQEQTYKPLFYGTLRSSYEADLEVGDGRFAVKHVRVGAKGKLNSFLGYDLQTDINAEGKIIVLDTYGEAYIAKNFTLNVGQQPVPYSEAYVVAPALYMFTSMAWMYPHGNPQARDIGVKGDYKFNMASVPVQLLAGVFNGTSINNPTWNKYPAVSSRLILGSMNKGFRTSIKYFKGFSEIREVDIYGLDMRYATNRFKLEAELGIVDSVNTNYQVGVHFIQGQYIFPIKEKSEATSKLKYIAPTTRFESMGQKIFENGFDIHRLTIGLNFGFDTKPLKGEFRINYENMFKKKTINNYIQNIATNKFLNNKLLLELVIVI